LESLEAREVLTVNTWIGVTSNFHTASNWTDGVPTADDILVFSGLVATPIETTTNDLVSIVGDDGPLPIPPPPPPPPPPYSNVSVTFPDDTDADYEAAYAGIRILNGYGGTITFPTDQGFGEYTQNSGATSQAADTTISVTSTFGWVGGAINATSNTATMKLNGVTNGQIGEDTTTLSSGSNIVLDSGATARQTGVLQLPNGSDVEILEDCELRQRQITADPPPTAGFEIDGSGNVKVSGRFLSEGGKVPSVKVEVGGTLDVERRGNKGGLTVTGKVPGGNFGVSSRGSIFLRNGETITADYGVEVTQGGFYTLSGFQIAQVATIDGRFVFEGDEIRLGLQNFLEDGTNLGASNTTLEVTKRTDLLSGDFKPKLDVNNVNNRDFIKTRKEFNCDTSFSIKPEAAAPAAGTLVLVSEDGFLTSLDPVNGDPTNFTMGRTPDGKKFEVK